MRSHSLIVYSQLCRRPVFIVWVALQFVIVVFPEHTHLLFLDLASLMQKCSIVFKLHIEMREVNMSTEGTCAIYFNSWPRLNLIKSCLILLSRVNDVGYYVVSYQK